jgi:shikimate kinase
LPLSPAAIFLVGFMGCGKSTVGARLAALLGRPFVDSDREIEAREGRTIAAIFAEAGEDRFRTIESELLLDCCGRELVVATGGGAFLRAATRRAMIRGGRTVWLDVSLESCRGRIGTGEGRPLWPSEDRLAQREIYERRRACYALAELRLVGDEPEQALARRLADRLGLPIP